MWSVRHNHNDKQSHGKQTVTVSGSQIWSTSIIPGAARGTTVHLLLRASAECCCCAALQTRAGAWRSGTCVTVAYCFLARCTVVSEDVRTVRPASIANEH